MSARRDVATLVGYAASPALAVLLVDLLLRGDSLRLLPTGQHVGLYALSVVVTGAFWLAVAAGVARLWPRRRAVAWTVCAAVGLVEGALLVGSYGYFEQFSVLPNVYGFEFLFEETEDAAAFVAADLTLGVLLLWLLVAGVTVAFLVAPHRMARPPAQRLRDGLRRRLPALVAAVMLAVAAPVLHNNVPKFPNAFLPEIHTVFSATNATERALGGHTQSIRLLGSGTRPRLETQAGELPFDVLFILAESLRHRSLSAYGYERQTTPRMDAFLAARDDRAVLFDRCYATSTRSLLAFPSFLTGAHPAQPGSVLHTQPLIFDYAKLFDNVDTFVIASQSYGWGNYIDFIRSPHLDHLWYRENSGHPVAHGTGIDDAHVPAHLAEHLATLPPGRRFVGLLHFYGTHQHYDSRPEDQIWGTKTKVDRYDASIHTFDRNIDAVLAALREAGRLDDTLIFFASDHGEAFGEKGYDGHLRTYYDVEARVPLWIHLPTGLLGDRSVVEALRGNADRPVSNGDLVPTFLALTGLDRHPEVKLRSERLLGLPLNGPLPPDRPLLMHNFNDAGPKAMFIGVGLVRGRHKYLLRIEAGRVWEELYDLEADPGEETNLWPEASPELRASLRRELYAHRNSRVVAERYLPRSEGTDVTCPGDAP